MATNLLICDDSKLARKQMAASLPRDWDINIAFAENGAEALDVIRAGNAEVMFVDLNMPVMDGYQTLDAINTEGLHCICVVVSGDIQPEARERVKSLGAIDFIKKPIDKDLLVNLLESYGLYRPTDSHDAKTELSQSLQASLDGISRIDHREFMQEASNVAMGQAADLLARLLNVFVQLPVPNVNLLDVGELEMALTNTEQNASFSAVCQGFIGSGISGEALLIFRDSSFSDIARLLNYKGEIDRTAELELLMEVACILTGACINGLGAQLDITFSQGHPVVLGQHVKVNELIGANANSWKQTMAIEICYSIENYDIECDLLLLFTEDSLDTLYDRIDYILN